MHKKLDLIRSVRNIKVANKRESMNEKLGPKWASVESHGPARGIKRHSDNQRLVLEGPEKFSRPKSHSKNLTPYDYRAVLFTCC